MTSSHLDSPALRCPAARIAVEPAEGQIAATILAVLDVAVAERVDIVDALAVAGALEIGTPHPVAVAIAAYAAEKAPFWPAMTAITRIDELGVSGDTGARDALIGSPALLAAHGISLPEVLTAAVVDAAIDARTPLVLAWNGQARAVLVVGEVATTSTDAAPVRRNLTWTVITLLAAIAMVTGLRRLR